MCFDFGLSDTVLEVGTVPFAFFEMMRFSKVDLAKKKNIYIYIYMKKKEKAQQANMLLYGLI